MEVLAVGLSRSGTDSLRNALIQLGYDNTYHGWEIPAQPSDNIIWTRLYKKKYHGRDDGKTDITTEDFDAVLGDSIAVTDTPASMFAKDLIAAYPDAKVILNIRPDLDAWYASTISTFCGNMVPRSHLLLSYFDAELFWFFHGFLTTMFREFYHGSFEKNGKWVKEEHTAMVRGLTPKEKLLEWKVEDGWEPLCKFLEKDVPQIPFPNGNTTDDLGNRLATLHGKRLARAKRNATVAGGVVLGLAAMALHYTLLQ
ncbi:hypothetical protein NPX13_g913 [Xylaria arbuscula]|uniref:P-loop containing nucleoside triphosphate hydrolase protein n=1 Tax=Xylaria arbuscula TaxID=114810 RepID=A0A9W8NN14_9PEZI|nr:hypothetical protein NPX13_g913 [Xylaria arbuscula]